MKLKVDAIVSPVLFEEEDTGLVELAIALEDEVVYIFNPRQQRWNTNFVWNGVEAIGLTAIGRTSDQVAKEARRFGNCHCCGGLSGLSLRCSVL